MPTSCETEDFGVWSTHEQSASAREIEAITELQVGQVSAPIDGFNGFGIFKRTKSLERTRFASTFLVAQSRSEDSSWAGRARQLRELPRDVRPLLRGQSKNFEALKAKYCCEVEEHWTAGRGDPALEMILASLEVGGVSSRPLERGGPLFRFHKRLAPRLPDALVKPVFQLPKPAAPDVDSLVSNIAGGQIVSEFLRSLERVLGGGFGLDLSPDTQKRCTQIVAQLARDIETVAADRRIALLNSARQDLQRVLSKQEYAALQANIRSELSRVLMSSR